MIEAIQQHLTTLYDLPHAEDVRRFLINEETFLTFTQKHGLQANNIDEQLLLIPDYHGDTVDVGLYFRGDILENLRRHRPDCALDDRNARDFFIAVEGVSHFLLIDHRSRHDFVCTALEMEMQAEIDKFLTAYFYRRSQSAAENCGREIFDAIFENFQLRENLAAEEAERYRIASDVAKRFCHRLLKHHLEPKADWQKVLKFLRLFYRRGWEQKYNAILASDDAFMLQ